MKRLFVVLVIINILVGCQSAPVKQEVVVPAWIEQPDNGAVGSSTTHIKGRYYQEQLAIERARERLAARYGVTVSSVSTIKEKVRNDNLYVAADRKISQIIENKEVKAHVREVWFDAHEDVVWVWLYPVD